MSTEQVAVAVRHANAEGLLAVEAAQAPPQRSLGELGLAKNEAVRHASAVMRSERARVDAGLLADFQSVLQGHTIYLPRFFAGARDFGLLRGLATDLAENAAAAATATAGGGGGGGGGAGMISWSQHLKHENPTFSPTFCGVVEALEDYFDVHVYATRLNFYRDGSDWKPFHRDSHAFGADGQREDFTMGVSFGAARQLDFLHPGSGATFGFPQCNGDVFAFTSDANSRFKHGVPRMRGGGTQAAPRFSIIAWGRRRSLNARNGGAAEVAAAERMRVAEREASRAAVEIRGSGAVVTRGGGGRAGGGSRLAAHAPERGSWKVPSAHQKPPQSPSPPAAAAAAPGVAATNERVMEGDEVLGLVDTMIEQELRRPVPKTAQQMSAARKEKAAAKVQPKVPRIQHAKRNGKF